LNATTKSRRHEGLTNHVLYKTTSCVFVFFVSSWLSRRWKDDTYICGLRRQPTRRAQSRGVAVSSTRVQHRIVDRRAHARTRHVADDDRRRDRRIWRAPARSESVQAGARPPRRESELATVDRARSGAHQ